MQAHCQLWWGYTKLQILKETEFLKFQILNLVYNWTKQVFDEDLYHVVVIGFIILGKQHIWKKNLKSIQILSCQFSFLQMLPTYITIIRMEDMN